MHTCLLLSEPSCYANGVVSNAQRMPRRFDCGVNSQHWNCAIWECGRALEYAKNAMHGKME